VTVESTYFDKAAIGLSFACAVHCLALPVALLMLPTLAASAVGDEHFHQWMLMVVLPTSLIALIMGCHKHRDIKVLRLGLLGLLLLSLTAFFGHELLGEIGEKISSVLCASLIAVAHFKNHRLCKQAKCRCASS
jgi:hypothetical protein